MKKYVNYLSLLLILGVAFCFFKPYFFPSEEDVIRKTLNNLAEDLSFSAATSMVVKMAKADGLRKYFTSNVTVSVDNVHPEAENISGRAAVMEVITLSRTLTSLDVYFSDMEVVLSQDKKTAVVTLAGKFSLDHSASGRAYQLIQFDCVKNEKQWQIEKAETLKLL